MVIVWIAAALALLVAAGAYIIYLMVFHRPGEACADPRNIPKSYYGQYRDEMLRLIDRLDAAPCERVSIVSRDGLKLVGRYYYSRDGAPLAICFHGYRGTALRDFCGGANLSLDMGQNVLLIDERAQCGSEGASMTFGAKERYDCLEWIAYAIGRFGAEQHIYIYGVSMGAATVLLAAGLGLPSNVKAVVADSPYSSAEGIIKKVLGGRGLPAALYPLIVLSARLYAGFSIADADVTAAVRKSAVPILLVHGESDGYVPCEMSAELLAACPGNARRETYPGADHCMSGVVDAERYRKMVIGFLAEAENGAC